MSNPYKIEVMIMKSLIWNMVILRSPGEANFVDIIEIVTIFIGEIFEDSERNYVPKWNLYLCFLI